MRASRPVRSTASRRAGGGAEVEVGAAADERDREPVGGERAHRLGGLGDGGRLDDERGADADDGVRGSMAWGARIYQRSARPADLGGVGTVGAGLLAAEPRASGRPCRGS